MAPSTPLTARSTVGDWLDHPAGGPAIRELIAAAGGGEAGVDQLAAARGLSLEQLVPLSRGLFTAEILDTLVRAANGGELPEEQAATGWQERIVPGRFTGATVVVTGAASGIGRATASRVAREGGRVVAADVTADGLAAFRASLPEADVVTVTGDITREESVAEIVAAAAGRVDALANVAGINDDFSPLAETEDAMWERVLGVNLTGTFRLTRAVLPLMLAAGRGSVVNVASEAGLRGNAAGTAYTVSKHGVVGLTRSAAFMYGPRGIRVNAVAPGGVATGIPFPPKVSAAGQERLSPFHGLIPSVATAEQLAASISYLLSDDAVNVNGAVLPSDGGWSVQ